MSYTFDSDEHFDLDEYIDSVLSDMNNKVRDIVNRVMQPTEPAIIGLLHFGDKTPPRPTTVSATQGGTWLYVIHATSTQHFKIGVSRNVEKRLKRLQATNACRLEVIRVMPYATRAIEQRLHRKFESKRMNGEWFNLDENDLAALHDAIDSLISGCDVVE